MAQRGQDYIVQASSDGNSFTDVGKIRTASLSREKETIETNNFDSPDDAESIAGMKNWGISAGYIYIYDDAGQALIEAAYASVDPYYFRLTDADDTAGVIRFSGQAHVTSLELEFGMNEVVEGTIDLEGTGTLTRQAIPTA